MSRITTKDVARQVLSQDIMLNINEKRLGNKDGTVNERIIPFLTNIDDVLQMDWCSCALESMVRGCKEYKQGKYFSGPLLLMAVEKTVPVFMSWNPNLMLKREQEKIELGGFGRLPIVEGLQVIATKNLIENKSVTEDMNATEDVLDKNEDFKSLNFKLMVDTDSKLNTALSLNPEDKKLKKTIEERNNLFLDFYKEEDNNGNVESEEIDRDKNGNTNETECDTDLKEVEGNKDECEKDKGMKNNRKQIGNQMKMKEPMEDQPLPVDASPIALSPGYVVDSDPEKDEKDPKEDPAYYPADRRNNDDDESSNDDDDDDDVEKDDEDKEGEEHLAPADPSDVSTDDLVPSS
nr:ulp1 protease family, C-terminal catalytic domain-containing protein [Tanacetum cinerariifolium]